MTTLQPWTKPDYYIGEHWDGWYFSGFDRIRDSDDLTESNFAAALRALGGESPTVRVVHESHWLLGWVEWIGIDAMDDAAIGIAESLNRRVADYAALDGDDWSRREMESAQTVWADCYTWRGRIEYIRTHRYEFNFRDLTDMLAQVRGRYFRGYASGIIS